MERTRRCSFLRSLLRALSTSLRFTGAAAVDFDAPPLSVTTVGGTHYIPEVAVGFSGGGFSNYVSVTQILRVGYTNPTNLV